MEEKSIVRDESLSLKAFGSLESQTDRGREFQIVGPEVRKRSLAKPSVGSRRIQQRIRKSCRVRMFV